MKVFINYEKYRELWHKAVDSQVNQQIEQDKKTFEQAGITLCTTQEEYDKAE